MLKSKPSVELGSGETLIRSGFARNLGTSRFLALWLSSEGRLHLTSSRLVWRRSLLNLPFMRGPESLEIPLADIERCSVRNYVLLVEAGDTRHWFLPYWWLPLTQGPARKWRDAIVEAIERL